MREILFRGKKSDGKWEYGNLYVVVDCAFIVNDIGFQKRVIPETVGQFTGLTDKNGTKIFEGDIVELPTGETGVIRWEEDTAQFDILYDENILVSFESYYGKELEVIGNIHDNPELLGGADNA